MAAAAVGGLGEAADLSGRLEFGGGVVGVDEAEGVVEGGRSSRGVGIGVGSGGGGDVAV